MSEWEITDPGEVVLEPGIEGVDVRLANGSLGIAVADGPPRLLVAAIEGPPLMVSQQGATLVIHHTEGPWMESLLNNIVGMVLGGRRTAEVTLVVPQPVRVVARTTTADVLVSGVIDSIVETVSGAITASNIRQSLRLTTVSGNIAAADIGDRLALKTVSGEVTIAASSLTELTAHTVSGDMVVDADLGAGMHTFRGVSGGLALRVPAEADLDIEATTVSGAVASSVGEVTITRRPGSQRMRALAGEGRARLRCHTVSGDLTVVARAERAA